MGEYTREELNINDNLIMYLSNGEEPSLDKGGGSPSYFV
jgi:site-specific DNA recombinase